MKKQIKTLLKKTKAETDPDQVSAGPGCHQSAISAPDLTQFRAEPGLDSVRTSCSVKRADKRCCWFLKSGCLCSAGRQEEDLCSSGVTIMNQDFIAALETLQDAQSTAIGAPKVIRPCSVSLIHCETSRTPSEHQLLEI